MDGDTVVVGASGDDDNGLLSGAVYVFSKPAGGWVPSSEAGKLKASDGAADHHFGVKVSVDGDTILVGAQPTADNDLVNGRAYVFVEPTTGWADAIETIELDGVRSDRLKSSVWVTGDTFVAGGDRTGLGSAYLYDIQDWTGIADSDADTTKHIVMELTNGKEYAYAIRSANANGHSPSSNSVRAIPSSAAPDSARASTAIPRDRAVILSWIYRTDTIGFTEYQYRQSEAGGDFGSWIDIPQSGFAEANFSSYQVSGLTADSGYAFQIRATTDNGDGPESETVDATPYGSEIVLSPADATLIEDGTSSSFTAEFTHATDADRYTLTLEFEEGSTTADVLYSLEVDQEVAQFIGKRALDEYEFALSADHVGTGAGIGDATYEFKLAAHLDDTPEMGEWFTMVLRAYEEDRLLTESNVVTINLSDPVPLKPKGLTAEPASGNVALSWDDPDNPSITRYEYRFKEADAAAFGDWTPVIGSGALTTQHTVDGLTNGAEHTFHVRAASNGGEGPASDPVSGTPRGLSAPTNLVGAGRDESVELTWNTPSSNGGSAITNYQYRQDAGSWTDMTGSGPATERYTVTGLTNGIAYTFNVRAQNADGPGLTSDPAIALAATTPGAPQNLLATKAGSREMTLTWDPPLSDGGLPISGYEFSLNDGRWMTIEDSDADTASYVVEGLTNGEEYGFRIRAMNAVGSGVPASVRGIPLGPPGRPEDFSTSPGNKKVSLDWDPPSDDGGSAITGYEYRQYDETWASVGSDETGPVDIAVLEPSIPYLFEVRAVNEVGTGVPALRLGMAISPPGVPSDLKAAGGDGLVELAWKPAGDSGSPVVGYQYRYKHADVDFIEWVDIPDSAAGSVNELSYTVESLTNGEEHTFEVRAGNKPEGITAVQYGPESDPAIATPMEPRAYAGSWSAYVEAVPVYVVVADDAGVQIVLTVTFTVDPDEARPLETLSAEVSEGADLQAEVNTEDGLENLIGFGETPAGPLAPGITFTPVGGSSCTPDVAERTLECKTVLAQRIYAAEDAGYSVFTVSFSRVDPVEYTATVNGIAGDQFKLPELPTIYLVVDVLPGSPENLKALPGDSQAQITWSPAENYGLLIDYYEYRQGGGNWQTVSGAGAARSVTAAGLSNGQTYQFAVRAVNRIGRGKWAVAETTLASPTGSSATPIGPSATPTGPSATPSRRRVAPTPTMEPAPTLGSTLTPVTEAQSRATRSPSTTDNPTPTPIRTATGGTHTATPLIAASPTPDATVEPEPTATVITNAIAAVPRTPEPEPIDGAGGVTERFADGGFPWWLIIVALVIIVVLAYISYRLLREPR